MSTKKKVKEAKKTDGIKTESVQVVKPGELFQLYYSQGKLEFNSILLFCLLIVSC